ncbi:hypothetical protein [Catenulispora subtropica]
MTSTRTRTGWTLLPASRGGCTAALDVVIVATAMTMRVGSPAEPVGQTS